MRSLPVVEADPACDQGPGVGEGSEDLDPNALFLEAAEEALDQAVLLRGVPSDELLPEPVVATRGPEAAALEERSGQFPATAATARDTLSPWPPGVVSAPAESPVT